MMRQKHIAKPKYRVESGFDVHLRVSKYHQTQECEQRDTKKQGRVKALDSALIKEL